MTDGFKFAPLTGPAIITPISTPMPTYISAHTGTTVDRASATKKVVPINSKKKTLVLDSELIWLYFWWTKLSMTDCFNELLWSYLLADDNALFIGLITDP